MGKWGFDPLGYSFDLPLSVRLYPLGFAFQLSTNSPDVLLGAEESWGGFPRYFDEPPVEVHIVVQEGGEHASGMIRQGRRHLLALLSDERNFVVMDMPGGFALGSFTTATVSDRPWFRYFYLDTIANLILWQNHLTRIHAACVMRDGRGVLLCGPSGAGKSCLAYACARRGWTLVSDEAPSIVRRTRERIVIGKPQQIHLREGAFGLFPELRGRPVHPNPVGKISIEVQTAELPDLRTDYRACVAAVVFLDRSRGGPPRLAPLEKDEALRRLEADLPLFEEPAHSEHRASLANLVDAPVFDLRYDEAADAVNELEHAL